MVTDSAAGTLSLTSAGGTIGTPNGKVTAPLQVSAFGISANTGVGKGLVNLQDNLAGATELGASSAKSFTINTAQSIAVTAPLAASNVTIKTAASNIFLASSVGDGTGAISLEAAGAITQSSGLINAKSLSLTGTSGNNIQTNVAILTAAFAANANATINNVGSGPLILNGLSADNITVTSAGAIVENKQILGFSSVTLNAGGAITVNGNVVTAGTVSLNTVNGGIISEAKNALISGSTFVGTSDFGDINTSKGQLKANFLTLGTSGNVVISDNLSSGNVTVSDIVLPVKSFSFTGSSNNAGVFTLGKVSTSKGSISAVWTGSVLNVAPGAVLSAVDGNITLQQLGTSTVNIGANAIIHASSTIANTGNVTIVVGAIPNKGIVGTPPPNVFTNYTGKGQIFFGPPGKLTATAVSSTLNAFGRNILFNSTGAAITLQDNVVITADPPLKPGEVISDHALYNPVSPTVVSILPTYSPSAVSLGNTAVNPIITTSGIEPNLVSVSNSVSTTSSIQSNLLSAINANLSASGSNGFNGSLLPGVVNSSTGRSSSSDYSNHGSRSTRLNNEALLLAPDKDQQIETKFGRLSVKANSMVLVISTDRCLTVFNLDDRKRGSVVAHLEGSDIVLEPGRHLTVARASSGNFSAVNPAKFVGHRRLISDDCGSYKVHRSEFHLPSVIGGLSQLREFVRSTDPAKRAAAEHMLKTAAILNSLGGSSSERFELYNEDLVTAYVNH